jgi:hypothetical protein
MIFSLFSTTRLYYRIFIGPLPDVCTSSQQLLHSLLLVGHAGIKVQKATKENPMDVKFDFTEGYAKVLESRSPNNMYSDSRT